MARYVVVRDSSVENVIEWDGQSTWTPPQGCDAIQSDTANIGDTWDGKVFIVPPVEIDVEVTMDVTTAVLAPGFKSGSLTNEQRDEAIKLLLSRL